MVKLTKKEARKILKKINRTYQTTSDYYRSNNEVWMNTRDNTTLSDRMQDVLYWFNDEWLSDEDRAKAIEEDGELCILVA